MPSNETNSRKADNSLMDTVIEVIDALKGGMAGAARNSANPASEATRARQRTEQRMRQVDPGGRLSDRDVENMRRAAGKAYGGKAKKMMCGGKAKK